MGVAVDKRATSSVPFEPLRNPELCDQQAFGGTRAWTKEEWRKSREWFEEKVAVFVLSLPSSEERRNLSKLRFKQLNIKFEFSDGIDIRAEGALEVAQRHDLIPKTFNITRAQTEADT